jgi:hypothetical protein
VELDVLFLLERDSVQINKYDTVTGAHPSHICFKGHYGITVEVKWRPKRSNETIHRQVNPLLVPRYSFNLRGFIIRREVDYSII